MLAGFFVWSALGSLLATTYSYATGCVTRWHEFRGMAVPYVVVNDIVSQPLVGVGYAVVGAAVGSLFYWTILRMRHRPGT